MATNSNSMIIVLLAGIVGFVLFGCKLGIQPICKITGQKGGGLGGVDLASLSPEQRLALEEELGVEEFPRVSMTEAMEHLANMIAADIDKGTYQQLGRNTLFELKADLFSNFKTDLAEVAEFNDMRLQPLEGRALAGYSRLVLELADINGIALAPGVEAAFQANLFAGTPGPGVITANRAVLIA
jgi:hypothetical protein